MVEAESPGAFFLNLWYAMEPAAAADVEGPTVGPASSLQLPSPGQCVQRSHHTNRPSRPKKRGFGAIWGEGLGRGGTRGETSET